MSARLPFAVLCLAFVLGCEMRRKEALSFSYLTRSGDTLQTTHGLNYTFIASGGLELHGPSHRIATFNDVPFEISLAAFIRDDDAIMVHAERVADGSGASNYTRYPESDWPDGDFRLAPPGCVALSEEDIDGEHDLEWLRDRGFTPTGAIYTVQYFASTPDFNDEIVISFLLRVNGCDDTEANERAFEEAQELLEVIK